MHIVKCWCSTSGHLTEWVGTKKKQDHSGPRVGGQAGKETVNSDGKSSGVGIATVSSTWNSKTQYPKSFKVRLAIKVE